MSLEDQHRAQLDLLESALKASPEFRSRPTSMFYHRGPARLCLVAHGGEEGSAVWEATRQEDGLLVFSEVEATGERTAPAPFEISLALRSALRFIARIASASPSEAAADNIDQR